jgi:hypothetical protein
MAEAARQLPPVEALVRRDRLIVAGGLAVLILLAWLWLLSGAGTGMDIRMMSRLALFPGGGDAMDMAFQHLQACSGGARLHPGLRVAVHQREDRRVGEAETDVQIPPRPQVLDRVRTGFAERLLLHVGGEAVFGDRLEQSALVTEEAVDRRRLDAGGRRDRPGGQRVATACGEEVGGRRDDPRSRVIHAFRC